MHGIFTRNLVSPIYRGIGRFVAQPLHRVITGGRDASPYRNNMYHRMVARRNYFEDANNTRNPGHPIRNSIASRVQAIFNAEEGNEAVLRAGAADIRENIIEQETSRAVLQNLETRKNAFDSQIQSLERELSANPIAKNAKEVKAAIDRKKIERRKVEGLIKTYQNNKIETAQTDAVSDEEHSIASKEVNTMRVTVIKGFAKGLTCKFVGPKIHDWLLERGKTTKTIQVETEVPVTKKKWVDSTYKTETVPVYEDALDTGKTMKDIISSNKGKSVTGYYSVYGGERGGATYQLAGNENVTGIFLAQGTGGMGYSDTIGLTAPTFTDGTFASYLLDSTGSLNQNITLEQLVEVISSGNIDVNSLSDMYVSIGDQYWVKLTDLVGDMTTKVQVGEEIKKVIDVAGHYEDYTDYVTKLIDTTEVVTIPAVEAGVKIGSKVGEGAVMVDGVLDVAENLRKTTTDVKSNKKKPRKYTFNEEVDDIPKSRKEYRQNNTREDDDRE